MNEFETFVQLIQQAQNRDAEAAAELMRRYEPAVRRAVRLKLFDARMRRVFDSMDICQSVMGNFFDRLAHGQYPLETPEQLVRLLVTMAQNKLTDQVRRETAQRRGGTQKAGFDINDDEPAAPGPSPSKVVENRELLEEVRRRMTDEERRLLDLRSDGDDWAEIAQKVGCTADAARKKLARALDRVQQEVESPK